MAHSFIILTFVFVSHIIFLVRLFCPSPARARLLSRGNCPLDLLPLVTPLLAVQVALYQERTYSFATFT